MGESVSPSLAEASGSRTHRRQEACRPPVLKITWDVLNGYENFLLYLILQSVTSAAF